MFISEARAENGSGSRKRIEPVRAMPNFPPSQKKRLLQKVTEAGAARALPTITRYVGPEALLAGGRREPDPVDRRADPARWRQRRAEMVIGMAHAGGPTCWSTYWARCRRTCSRVRGQARFELPSGDVKYHNGFSSTISTAAGGAHLSRVHPSHLEIVDPVVEGSVRARQRRRNDKTGDQVMPILLHGDAASRRRAS